METSTNKIRKTVLTVVLGLMVGLSASAQVFVLGEDNKRQGTEINGEYSNVIAHSETHDQTNYVPMGSGLLLLTAFGSAYALKKKTGK